MAKEASHTRQKTETAAKLQIPLPKCIVSMRLFLLSWAKPPFFLSFCENRTFFYNLMQKIKFKSRYNHQFTWIKGDKRMKKIVTFALSFLVVSLTFSVFVAQIDAFCMHAGISRKIIDVTSDPVPLHTCQSLYGCNCSNFPSNTRSILHIQGHVEKTE